jgi:hypothetical protein
VCFRDGKVTEDVAVGGRENDDRQENTKAGMTLALPIGRQPSGLPWRPVCYFLTR